MQLFVYDRNQLSENDLRSIVYLSREIWPPPEGMIVTMEGDIAKMINVENRKIEKHFLLKENEKLIGYAKIFSREIKTDNKKINNMALASVCIKNEYRKKELGKLIVKAAFEFVDNKIFECSIFQTQAPQFYEKLGAKQIKNKFINSLNNNENPWWDPYIMLYPKEYEITEKEIDLLGKGY